MKRRSNVLFIVALVATALILSGAYALLAAAINITGTATGTGDFKIQFTNATVSDSAKANATISTDGTTLTIGSTLSYPGDTATVNFTIKNTGSLAATVNKLTVTNPSSADFTVTILGLNNIQGTTLAAGAITTGSIVITWNQSSTNPKPTDVTFDVTLDYLQATI